jgi:hypothetical protein
MVATESSYRESGSTSPTIKFRDGRLGPLKDGGMYKVVGAGPSAARQSDQLLGRYEYRDQDGAHMGLCPGSARLEPVWYAAVALEGSPQAFRPNLSQRDRTTSLTG